MSDETPDDETTRDETPDDDTPADGIPRDDWVDEDPGDPSLHAELAALLRAAAPVAPPAVHRRALGRIHAERELLLLARTLGGALVRVAAALTDYLSPRGVSEKRSP